MESPTLEQINELRRRGFRPSVVSCFIHERKVLLFFKQEYSVWMFPQSGIENKQTPEEAIKKGIGEEIDETLIENSEGNYELFYRKDLVFAKSRQGLNELETDEGDKVHMKGKFYLFYAINVANPAFDIEKTDFDDYFWLDHQKAKYLTYNKNLSNKKLIVAKAIDLLKEQDFID